MPDEPLPQAVRRTLIELADDVMADLEPGDALPIDSGVHDARKKLKRLRAVLRLVRDPIGEHIYRHENAVLRDAGRSLSPVRDAWVQLETLNSLLDWRSERLAKSSYETTEAWLRNAHTRTLREFSGRSPTTTTDLIQASRSRLAEYPLTSMIPDDFGGVAVGLERVYRRGRRSYRRASRTPNTAELHELRKRVKYLRYQLEFLASHHRPVHAALSEDQERLGELLGRDHDLAVLGVTISGHAESCPDERSRSSLLTVVAEERAVILHESLPLGSRLYAEEPEVFVRRIGGYWAPDRPNPRDRWV